ncbi:MAG: hypothetical protein RMH75_07585, partial [Archaeoglobaceae archaeon]|nr:hypothetical protein [Archaeoglobaceae archaeon]
MKIVQYPDFTTQESQVVISKRFKKIKIPVELSDRNQIDYKDGVIHIDKRLSDEKKILALHHEVEHFNFDLHEPIWVLSLEGLEEWFDPKNKDLIFKSSKKLFKQKNKILKISSIAMPCILPNRFDNLIEDIEIDKHLKEDHKLNVELREE